MNVCLVCCVGLVLGFDVYCCALGLYEACCFRFWGLYLLTFFYRFLVGMLCVGLTL